MSDVNRDDPMRIEMFKKMGELDYMKEMPSYLGEDLPAWLVEKNMFENMSKKTKKLSSVLDFTKNIKVKKETPSILDYRKKYELFNSELNRKKNDGYNPSTNSENKISVDSIMAERIPDPGVKLAKTYLKDVLKQQNLARMQAALAAEQNENASGASNQESKSAIMEKELNAKIGLLRRNPDMVKELLLKRKPKKKYSKDDVSGDRISPRPSNYFQISPRLEGKLDVSSNPKFPIFMNENQEGFLDEITEVSRLTSGRPTSDRPTSGRPTSGRPTSGSRESTPEIRGRSTTPSKNASGKARLNREYRGSTIIYADLLSDDNLAPLDIEKISVVRTYIKFVKTISYFSKLREKVDIDRLQKDIESDLLKMKLIKSMQIRYKEKLDVREERRKKAALMAIFNTLGVCMRRKIKQIRSRKVDLIKQFITDHSGQAIIQIVLRRFRFRVIKCQRWSRDFFACHRCRMIVLCRYIDEKIEFPINIFDIKLTQKEKWGMAEEFLFGRRQKFKKRYEEYQKVIEGSFNAYESIDYKGAKEFLKLGIKETKNSRSTRFQSELDVISTASVTTTHISVSSGDDQGHDDVKQEIDPQLVPQIILDNLDERRNKLKMRPFLRILTDPNTYSLLYSMGNKILDEKINTKARQVSANAAKHAEADISNEDLQSAKILITNVEEYLQSGISGASGHTTKRNTVISSIRSGEPIKLSPSRRRYSTVFNDSNTSSFDINMALNSTIGSNEGFAPPGGGSPGRLRLRPSPPSPAGKRSILAPRLSIIKAMEVSSTSS